MMDNVVSKTFKRIFPFYFISIKVVYSIFAYCHISLFF